MGGLCCNSDISVATRFRRTFMKWFFLFTGLFATAHAALAACLRSARVTAIEALDKATMYSRQKVYLGVSRRCAEGDVEWRLNKPKLATPSSWASILSGSHYRNRRVFGRPQDKGAANCSRPRAIHNACWPRLSNRFRTIKNDATGFVISSPKCRVTIRFSPPPNSGNSEATLPGFRHRSPGRQPLEKHTA